jgi:hypothetical protein
MNMTKWVYLVVFSIVVHMLINQAILILVVVQMIVNILSCMAFTLLHITNGNEMMQK